MNKFYCARLLAVILPCLLCAGVAAGANLDSLAGEWTLKHTEVNGEVKSSSMEMYGIYKPGAKWQLREDGSADCGGTKSKWSYDSAKRKINIQIQNFFGFWLTSIADADVASSGNELHISCQQVGQKIKFVLTGETAKASTAEPVSAAAVSVTDMIVDQEVFSEIIETVPGLPKKLTVRREYETTINSVTTMGGEANGKVIVGPQMLASVSAEIRARVEKSVGLSLGRKDEVTETYELDGDKITKVKVKWVERYRKGTITLVDGTKKDFAVCVGLRTIPEKL